MNEDLRKKAEKKVDAKLAFYICTIVFSAISAILLMLSFYLNGAGFWLRLPIPIFAMILAILYITGFGFPSTGPLDEEWKEAEIEKEMQKHYRQKNGFDRPREDLSETDILELKELERLKEKWGGDEELV